MRRPFVLVLGISLIAITAGNFAAAQDSPLRGMKLLEGYVHEPLQGFDSIVGRVSKKDGVEINYDIGSLPRPGGFALGGQFSDRPKLTPKDAVHWYREQTVNGQPVHLAHCKDDMLLVSFPNQGANFSVKVTSAAEMADALLMILTYPPPADDDGGK